MLAAESQLLVNRAVALAKIAANENPTPEDVMVEGKTGRSALLAFSRRRRRQTTRPPRTSARHTTPNPIRPSPVPVANSITRLPRWGLLYLFWVIERIAAFAGP